jgi:hypothetical protein
MNEAALWPEPIPRSKRQKQRSNAQPDAGKAAAHDQLRHWIVIWRFYQKR